MGNKTVEELWREEIRILWRKRSHPYFRQLIRDYVDLLRLREEKRDTRVLEKHFRKKAG